MKKILAEEDFQAWSLYKNTEHRWVFNKLEVALMQGLHAGPASTAPDRNGTYIYRPVYNLYGMGIGATKFEYNKETMYDSLINNDIVPPGHFWCEWLEGDHLSIDYHQDEGGFWHTRSVWRGEHENKNNLTKFESWKRLNNEEAPLWNKLPIDASFIYDPNVPTFNVEMIGNKIIEMHLRLGNDPFDEYSVGTTILPVWNDDEAPEGEWKGNLHEDLQLYSASGYLSDIRRGYIIKN